MAAECEVCGRRQAEHGTARTTALCRRELRSAGDFAPADDAAECYRLGFLRSEARAAVLQKQLDALGEGRGAQWSRDWPTTPGWHWFAGRTATGRGECLVCLCVVEQYGAVLVLRGEEVIAPETGARGLWMPARVPPMPDDAEGA